MILALSGAAAWVTCVAMICLTVLILAGTLRWWYDDGRGPPEGL